MSCILWQDCPRTLFYFYFVFFTDLLQRFDLPMCSSICCGFAALCVLILWAVCVYVCLCVCACVCLCVYVCACVCVCVSEGVWRGDDAA
jgi:hypothetical protein